MKSSAKWMQLVLMFGAGWTVLAGGTAHAAITNACVTCHTMHNSQNGATVTAGGPRGSLLNNTCAGCHTGNGVLKKDATTGAPFVMVTAAPANQLTYLPGGYFYKGLHDSAADKKYHNVASVDGDALKDANMPDMSPPGYTQVVVSRPANAAAWTTKLTCAGTYGCHGDPAVSDEAGAIAGWHHNPTGSFYRMLKGINGTEGSTYNIVDNVYYASANGAAGTDTATISYLCSECHGNFHKNANTKSGTVWIRHPSDAIMSKTTPDNIASYGAVANAYNDEVPVGTDTLAGKTKWTDVAAGAGFVMCLSCHFAHGSAYDDLLRFDYTTMITGTAVGGAGKGCFRCHTAKDGI